MRRLFALLLLAAATALLAGCGGGEGDDDVEQEIRELAEASAIATDPGACTRYFTLSFVEQITKVQGQAAISACEASVGEGEPAESITVSEIEVDGREGSVVAAYEGGSSDGQTMSYALLRDEDGWKLDELTGFPVFDRQAWLRASAEASYRRSHTPTEVEETACSMERLRELDDESLQELVIDPSPQPLIEIAQACKSASASV